MIVGQQRRRVLIAVIILLGGIGPVGVGVIDAQAPESPTNETTSPPIHQNPDNASANSNLTELSAYFRDELSTRLIASTTNINQSRYERARELIGDEYELSLSDYREVALELDQSERAALFNQVRNDQQQYVGEVQRLRQLQSEYEQARENDDEERARQLAREFNRESENLTANASELVSTYQNVSNETGISSEPATEQIVATQSEINETATNITQREFLEITLNVRLNRSNISFNNPGQVTGRIAVKNGSGIGGEVVTIRVGSRQYEVETEPNGRFQLFYRPVTVSPDAKTVPVTYQPAGEGAYLPASDNISTDIQPVNASLDTFTGPPTVGFSDRIKIQGQVVVGDRVVSELPLTVEVDDIELTRATTDTDGAFDATAEFPADIGEGEQVIRLRTTEQRAVQLKSNRTIRVEITQTQLRAQVASRSVNSVEVTGRLQTNQGGSVPAQTVTLSAGTQEVQVETAENGTFTGTLDLSRGSLEGGEDAVMVAFSGGGNTNLGPSSTSVSVSPSPSPDSASSQQQLPLREILIVVVVIIMSGGTLAIGSYRGWFDAELPNFGNDETDVMTDGSPAAMSEYDTRDVVNHSVESVTPRERLNRGEIEQAVLQSYGRIWVDLQTHIESDPQSHWALYNAVESTSLAVDESLYELTSAYEQTAYSPTALDLQTGRAAIEAGEAVHDALIDTDDDSDSNSDDDK